MAFPFLPRIAKLFRADPPAPVVRHLDAAAGGRRGGGLGTFHSLNAEVMAGASLVRSRARYLARNDGFMSNGVGNWSAALVGAGIRPNAKADATIRRAVSRAFETWADDADATGRSDFWSLQMSSDAYFYELRRHPVLRGVAQR